ncbi:MAG: zf-TFIIB domain-containing protein [Thermoanaerobaculia bacterium]
MVDLEELGKIRENEWFRLNEQELLRAARARREARSKADEDAQRQERRRAHFMRCPKCGGDLKEIEAHGVKVDRCGECEGVFFDAGELDSVLLQEPEKRRSFFRRLMGMD